MHLPPFLCTFLPDFSCDPCPPCAPPIPDHQKPPEQRCYSCQKSTLCAKEREPIPSMTMPDSVPPLLQLSDLVALVRGKLSRMQRAVLSALIVIEVHAKDVVDKLIQENVVSVNDFEWISQLR